MSKHTPDAYIERHWLDEPEGPSTFDSEMRCDKCERPMPGVTDTGLCAFCVMEWDAAHQLTFPDSGSESEWRKMTREIGPEATGLVFILGKLSKYLEPKE